MACGNDNIVLLNPASLEEEDLILAQANLCGMDRSLLSYQVRIINSRMCQVAIEQVLDACSGRKVAVIARKQSPKGTEFNSNFHLVTSDSEGCTPNLVNVIHVAFDAGDFYVHHFQNYVRIPCFSFYGIAHTVNAKSRLKRWWPVIIANLRRPSTPSLRWPGPNSNSLTIKPDEISF